MSGPPARYDEIGRGYATTRRPDARLAAAIDAALGDVALRSGLQRLAADLRSGAWDRANGRRRDVEALDLDYRLVMQTNREGRGGTA